MATELIDFLVKKNILTNDHLARVRAEDRSSSDKTLKHLIGEGLVNEAKLAEFLGKAFHIPVSRITSIDPTALELLSLDNIIKFNCLPFKLENNQVFVAIADPTRVNELKPLTALISYPLNFVLTTYSNLDAAIDKVFKAYASVDKATGTYGGTAGTAGPASTAGSYRPQMATTGSLQVSRSKKVSVSNFQIRKFAPNESVPGIVKVILSEGIAKGASDIHIESLGDHIRVRFRTDGVLHEIFHVPIELKDQLCSRIKVMAGLDISERRLPQDGRVTFDLNKTECHFRVSIMPANHGESIVLRVLMSEDKQLDVAKLGFSAAQLASFKKGIAAPNGMVLVTGPTGCGKTTTLYAALAEMNHATDKIATVEDPIESGLPGIIQVQVNNDTGLTFAAVLKALLRQDPDVLLVGEIRDQETALIAIQAALTGHLVLSTLHTNDAPSAIVRLLNMGVEPFMVLSAVSTVVAQRLLRTICPDCKYEVKVSSQELLVLKQDAEIIVGSRFYKGRGCGSCMGVGYKGRTAIYEVLELTDPLKEMLLKGENPVTFKRKAIELGMKTLRQAALQLVASGETTLEEALATTAED